MIKRLALIALCITGIPPAGAVTYVHPSRDTTNALHVGIEQSVYDAADQVLIDSTLDDWSLGTTNDAVIGDVNCLVSTGAQTISNANIVAGAVVVNAGTAVGTATAGVITFTAGTISQIQLDGVMTYICEEGDKFPQDVSGNGNSITSMTTTWGTSDAIPSWCCKWGHNKNLYFDGTASLDCGATLVGLGDFTVSFKLLANNDANDKYIMSQYIITDSGRFSIATRAGGAIRMSIGFAADSSAGKYIVGSSVNVGIVYVAATKTVSFYFDGVYDKSVTVAGFGAVYQGTNTLIGTLLANYFDGCIDDLFIKNSALDSTEIGALHAGTYAGLVDTKYPSKNAYIKDGEVYLPDAEGDDDATGTNVSIIYNSALPFRSKSVATFDGVAKLTKTGIVPTDNYTVEGTAVPTAGTGEIVFTTGTVSRLLLDLVEVGDFTVQLGKTVATVDGYEIDSGAGGLESFWSKRIEDPDGVLVASDYNLLTNPGGTYVHNAGEYSLILSDGTTNSYSQLLALPDTQTDSDGMITVIVK